MKIILDGIEFNENINTKLGNDGTKILKKAGFKVIRNDMLLNCKCLCYTTEDKNIEIKVLAYRNEQKGKYILKFSYFNKLIPSKKGLLDISIYKEFNGTDNFYKILSGAIRENIDKFKCIITEYFVSMKKFKKELDMVSNKLNLEFLNKEIIDNTDKFFGAGCELFDNEKNNKKEEIKKAGRN